MGGTSEPKWGYSIVVMDAENSLPSMQSFVLRGKILSNYKMNVVQTVLILLLLHLTPRVWFNLSRWLLINSPITSLISGKYFNSCRMLLLGDGERSSCNNCYHGNNICGVFEESRERRVKLNWTNGSQALTPVSFSDHYCACVLSVWEWDHASNEAPSQSFDDTYTQSPCDWGTW